MCVGALLECDAAALVYAVPNPVDGAAGTVLQLGRSTPGLGRAARRRLRASAATRPRSSLGTPRRRRRPAPDALGRADRSRRPGPRGPAAAARLGAGAFAILSRGEVSEWLMVPLSKSGLRKHRGFESHPLRHATWRRPGECCSPGRLSSAAERSPSGLGRRTGNAVWGNPSRVQIPPSPPAPRRP